MSTTHFSLEIHNSTYHINIQPFSTKTVVIWIGVGTNPVTFTNFFNAVPSTFEQGTAVSVEILHHNTTAQSLDDIAKALAFILKKPISLLTDFDHIDSVDASILKTQLVTHLRTAERAADELIKGE